MGKKLSEADAKHQEWEREVTRLKREMSNQH